MSTSEKTPQDLREEIAATRHELGATVEHLAAKTDLKARLHGRVAHVKDKLSHTRERITERGQQIASNVPLAITDSAKDGLHRAKATAERRPVRAAAIGGAAVGLITGWTLSGLTH
jgi:ElaB/YqjD/DUF883 family membrane-anchored ribosome-binding protein